MTANLLKNPAGSFLLRSKTERGQAKLVHTDPGPTRCATVGGYCHRKSKRAMMRPYYDGEIVDGLMLARQQMRLTLAIIMAGAAAVFSATASFTACNREPAARTAAERQQDEKLVQQVKASLNNSPSFKFPDVQVAAYKGRVQLSGFVVSWGQKRSAGDLARGVTGVRSVEISLKQ